VAGTYVLRLTASDTALTASADATITLRPANLPPTVSAGSNLTVTLPNAASLTGSVQDDGLPSGILIIAWSMVSGPGSVTFSDPSSRTTTASFAVAGTYVLRLSASDGALTTTADVTVTVQHAPPSTVGLAAYWTFDAPQTNTYATRDQSGNQFDAIFHGAVGTAAGTIGEAMAFSGGYLTADSDARTNSPTQLVNDLTLAVWVKTTNTTRWEGLIAKYVAGVNENGYVLRTTPAGNIGLRIGNANLLSGSSATTDTGTVVNDGRWHHVAAVIRLGQNVTYYIDGNQSSVQPVLSKAGVAAVGIWIGRNPWADYGDLFHGSLDDARVYSRALTSQEVSDLAAAGGSAAPTNRPPTVSAGSDATITLPSAASLTGSVRDDGLPSGTLSSTWSKASGPGSVSFANVSLPVTTAAFSAAGAYVLRLTASDGALTATSDVTITVQAGSIPPPVTEDLAAYWPFDAATTTTFGTADQSGNNLNATMHGTLAVSAGRIGEAMVFSGGYLTADSDTAANSKTQLVNDLSLSLWIKTTNTTRWEGLIAKYAAGVKEYGYVLRTTPAGNVGIRIGNSNLVSGNSAITDTTSSINDGRWHHIAVVIHLGQDVTFYVDGRQTNVQTVLSKAASTSVAVWIGRNAWVDYGDLFHGSLDDARIYARALTPQEVVSLAAIP
jgi:hypothetical protein